MTEFLHTINQEADKTADWMKQQSLELMRFMKPDQSYPHKRLILPSGVQRIYNSGMPMVYLPNGEWTTSGDKDVPITENLVNTFAAMGLELDTDLRPVHPWIDDLVLPDIGTYTGQGTYWNLGPNRTADPIIFRHDQPEPMVLLVLRRADDLWASPGGFIDPGETAEEAALREGFEETLIDISAYNPRMIPVYQGPVADPRATANAWPSTSAFAVHLDAALTKDLPIGMFAGNAEEVKAAGWFTLAQAAELDMFGSHKPMLTLATQTL